MTNTGWPQGTVLSPFLFTIYTADYRPQYTTCQVCEVKFAYHTALIGLTENVDYSYQIEIKAFVDYCETLLLELNVKETKELVIDYRRNKMATEAVEIFSSRNGKHIQVFGWHGLIMLTYWWKNEVHMYVVWGSCSLLYWFGVKAFYVSDISVWSYCVVVWDGNVGVTEKARTDRVTRGVGKMVEN